MTAIIILALIAAALVVLFARSLLAAQRDYEAEVERRMERKHRELEEARAFREAQPMGAMDLYLSSGRIPTGRTAEILALAQRSHDDRLRRERP